jgi:uncharacterized protein YpmB
VKRRNVIFLAVVILIILAVILFSFSVFQRALAPAAPTTPTMTIQLTWIGEAVLPSSEGEGLG